MLAWSMIVMTKKCHVSSLVIYECNNLITLTLVVNVIKCFTFDNNDANLVATTKNPHRDSLGIYEFNTFTALTLLVSVLIF